MVARNASRTANSVEKAIYHRATIDPGIMNARPLPDRCKNNLTRDQAASERLAYFHNYRIEKISKFLMPPSDWGAQSFPYSPKPDLLTANKNRNCDSSIVIPIHDVTTIDSVRMKEIDDLYKSVQLQREQYKDRTGLLHPLKYFRPDEYNFPSPTSLLPSYLFKYPETYTAYKVPTVLPLTYDRTIKIPYLPELAIPGIYSRDACIAFKS